MSRAYDRVWYSGVQLNRRTYAMCMQANGFLKDFYNISAPDLYQGSYSGAVSQSAGTHNGGGAIDTQFMGSKNKRVIEIYREVGFAIWYRPELWSNGKRVWVDHNHGIAVGDKQLAYAASKQVHDYYAGLNGLASHARDNTPRPNPIPVFRFYMPVVDLSNIRAQAKKTRNWDKHGGVKVVQRTLNFKRGSDLVVDGIFGPKTRRVFARYELQVGGDGDGIPGAFALRHLGLSRFKVKA